MTHSATINDAQTIARIYNHYILETTATFQEQPISAEEIAKKIEEYMPDYPWLVFEEQNSILGYAYVTRWKDREAYQYTIESSIYLAPEAAGKQIGSKLYAELIKRLRKTEYHAIIAGIALPNDASVALHEKFGFEKVAHFKETGYKFGKWIDVGYWELML